MSLGADVGAAGGARRCYCCHLGFGGPKFASFARGSSEGRRRNLLGVNSTDETSDDGDDGDDDADQNDDQDDGQDKKTLRPLS